MHDGEKCTVHSGDTSKMSACRTGALWRDGRSDVKEERLGSHCPEVFSGQDRGACKF